MFLHYILSEDKDSLKYRCFTAQRKSPSRNDWSVTVEKDFVDLGITQTYEEIKSMKKEKFGDMVKKLIEEKTINYLNSIKLKHTKVMHIVHNSLCLQEYLKPENVQSVNLSKFLFQSRTRMLEVKTKLRNDFKNEDLNCPLKCQNEDDQKHLLECDKIDANCIIGVEAPEYRDIFGNNVGKQMKIAAMLQTRMQKRKKIMTSNRN
jgi:predicted CopG family antitoxin